MTLVSKLIVCAFALVAIAPGFRGCGGEEGVPDANVTPDTGPPGECETDDDCEPDMCAAYRCVASICMPVEVLGDEDGDGRAAPPCGDDCDDTNPDVFAGASESCDGIDNDCDDTIDELAGASTTNVQIPSGGPSSQLVGWGDGVLHLHRAANGVTATPLTPEGAAGEPFVLFAGSSVREIRAARGESSLMVLTVQLDGFIRYIEIDETQATLDEGEIDLIDPDAKIALLAFSDGFAAIVESPQSGGPSERKVYAKIGEPPVYEDTVAFQTSNRPSMATDGTNLVVLTEDGELRFIDAAGAEVSSVLLPFTANIEPLISGDGRVYVISQGATSELHVVSVEDGLSASVFPIPSDGNLRGATDGETIGIASIGRSGRAWFTDASLMTSLPPAFLIRPAATLVEFDIVRVDSEAIIFAGYQEGGVALFRYASCQP